MARTELEKWEQGIEDMLDQIDDLLEDKYGKKFLLHPARSRRDTTSSKSQDGLIEIKCNFSLGLGSELGEGYVVQPRFVTLEFIPKSERMKVRDFVQEEISKRLSIFFPENNLSVGVDGNSLKIYGDLKF